MNKIGLFIFFFSCGLMAKSQPADFTYSTNDGLFCNPSTVQFTPSFTGSPKGFVWTFGNGTGSNSQTPSAIFNKAGSYTVKLIIIYQRTTATVTKTIVINPSVTQVITFDRNYICQPGVINFNATGAGNIASYLWDFGDGNTTSSVTSSTAHSYSSLGVYNVTLKATSSSGCFDTSQTTIKVQTIPVTGTRSPATGCVPATVSFNANASIPVNSVVTNYSWNFGDGSPIISGNINNASHIYNMPGNYSPNVTITTDEGCTATFNLGGTAYGTPPTNQMAYPVKAVICGSDSAQLVSKATKANSYTWNFGDGKTQKVTDTISRHKYDSLGMKTVSVTPAYNGCNGVPVTFQINIIGVIAKYHYSNTCADKKTFSFTNASQGNLSTISWDFGDGSPMENTRNVRHTFPSSGSFVTTMTVTDSITGCSDAYSQTIYTSEPALDDNDTSICKNSSTTFSIINDYSNPAATYTWNVVGRKVGPVKDSFLTIKTTLFGNFNNYVSVSNGSGYCVDTIRLDHTILVKGPTLNFTAPAALCLNDMYPVLNSSKPYIPTDSVMLWYWNFGAKGNNDTVYQPQPYLYQNPGTFKVTLMGMDINGCQDSLVKTVVVHPLPFLYVIPAIDTLCSGKEDTLFAFHSGNIQWNPSNSLTCGNCDTVLTKAATTTTYFIKDTSQFGCAVTDSILVNVYPPFTAVPLVSDPYICLNDTVHLNVTPPGKRITWSPATDITNPNNYDPVVSPRQTTTYTATLTDSVGCYSGTANINVHVKSLPTVDAGPDKFYPYNASFTINPIYSSNVASYNWTPADLLSCTTCPFPGGVATKSNTYVIKVTSDSGCIAKDSVRILVECKDAYLLVPNAFTPNNDNLNDYFYPITRGVQTIIRFSIYDRLGNLVYEAKNFAPNDKSFGWNGRINGSEQPSAVFVYYLEALCDSGEKLFKKGSVVLLK